MKGSMKTKSCNLDFDKENYIRHLHRLIKLKNGISTQQLRKNEQEKKLADTIQKMRKIHEYSRSYKSFQQHQLQRYESSSHKYSKIKSVIKEEIDRPILNMARSLKKKGEEVLQQNMKIFQKITQIKQIPKLNKQIQGERYMADNDYSHIYQISRVSQKSKTTMKVDLSDGKKFVKVKLDVTPQVLNQPAKDWNQFFLFQFQNGKNKARSQYFQISNIENIEFVLKIAKKMFRVEPISVKLIKIFQMVSGEKQVYKNTYKIEEVETQNTMKSSVTTPVRLEKSIGEQENEKDQNNDSNQNQQYVSVEPICSIKSDKSNGKFASLDKNTQKQTEISTKDGLKVKKGGKFYRFQIKPIITRMPSIAKQRVYTEASPVKQSNMTSLSP